jgi:plastocyanin
VVEAAQRCARLTLPDAEARRRTSDGGALRTRLDRRSQTNRVTFAAPNEPGRYQFWCPEPGHAEAGMVGEVIVG